jgi:two-component system, NarL family, nitrate/nitrite response regulator NarL
MSVQIQCMGILPGIREGSRRVIMVLDKLLAGSISKQIARELGISTRTVESHRQNLLRKLGIGSVKELMLHPIVLKQGE